MIENYEIVIGLEVHVELQTDSKIFCGCSTKFGARPNSLVCPVCMGMPGTYPILNKKVVEYSLKVAKALNCSINKTFRFDRKNYFYPDNPQNYQITQFYTPIGVDGYVLIGDNQKRIGIHEMHMEEDAGKLIHKEDETWIDYNRAGVPLIEIVTNHDMTDADEVIEFLEKLIGYIKYLRVSDCKLNEGSMRVDVNLSVNKIGDSLGTRTEMKNLNSFKGIRRAINAEANRQIKVLKSGEKVSMETRRWDDISGTSYLMRRKEEINDYRYFSEPDLMQFRVDDMMLKQLEGDMPEFQEDKVIRLVKEYAIPKYDAVILAKDIVTADLFEQSCGNEIESKKISNWIMCELLRVIKEKHESTADIKLSAKNLIGLLKLLDEGKITREGARVISDAIYNSNVDSLVYAKENHLIINKDNQMIKNVLIDVVSQNPQAINDISVGVLKARGYLIGQAMKLLKGQADAKDIGRQLDEILVSHVTSDNDMKDN